MFLDVRPVGGEPFLTISHAESAGIVVLTNMPRLQYFDLTIPVYGLFYYDASQKVIALQAHKFYVYQFTSFDTGGQTFVGVFNGSSDYLSFPRGFVGDPSGTGKIYSICQKFAKDTGVLFVSASFFPNTENYLSCHTSSTFERPA